ncbi:MAG TPA: FkbM family methyltransferase [Terriglobales bacterium]|nr:FkbM family methyltransferase [Terriglobales bacterium]
MIEFLRKCVYVPRAIWRNPSNHGERWRRLGVFLAWQVRKRLVRRPLTVAVFNGLRFKVYPDCQVSPGFIYYRMPECEDIAFIREHIQGGVLVDIGANVGSVSILLGDRVQHGLLFEPNPVAAARARENLALNQLAFEVHELALSDSSGTVELENSGGVNSSNRTVVGFKSAKPTRLVPRMTFDDFLRGRPPLEISIVKIDVEGHENAVLRGMRGFLRERRPRLVMFEYLQRTNLAETVGIFESAGYCVFELGKTGPSLLRAEVEPLQNLFACPVELAEEFGLARAERTSVASPAKVGGRQLF